MTDNYHLIVEEGKDKGKQITVPADGGRLGRSSKNDFVLDDPSLSRHHCRLFFKDGSLYVTDLGSANQTLVNSKPIQECRLNPGDLVAVGDSILKIVSNTISKTHSQESTPVIDLGLRPDKKAPARQKVIGTGTLMIIGLLMIALAIVIWVPKLKAKIGSRNESKQPVVRTIKKDLEIDYEKVLADSNNIFRYHLQIDKNKLISIQIDDIKNNRHVRNEKSVKEELIEELMKNIEASGFFSLKPQYPGIKPDVMEQWDLSVTIGAKTHRCSVINREKPELFQALVDDIIEEFGQKELGLEAIQFPPEKLVEMANNSYLIGKKLYDEREIKYGNLSDAIKCYKEAQIYLETIEPKPDFYSDILSSISDWNDEVQKKFDERNFSAQRSIRLRDWPTAAQELRIILEIIPDSEDKRYIEARKSLLEVERRLETKK